MIPSARCVYMLCWIVSPPVMSGRLDCTRTMTKRSHRLRLTDTHGAAFLPLQDIERSHCLATYS